MSSCTCSAQKSAPTTILKRCGARPFPRAKRCISKSPGNAISSGSVSRIERRLHRPRFQAKNSSRRPRPVVLCILDGWGERAQADDNAIAKARTPNWHHLMRRWPHAHLQASERFVGLPEGQMGNSEVGHTSIGAGRIVYQDLPRIDAAIADGKVQRMPALSEFVGKLKGSGGTAHVMGLMSPGGVHSHQKQIAALTRVLAEAGIPVAVHAFLDGRDT